jgi:hypothetical protein
VRGTRAPFPKEALYGGQRSTVDPLLHDVLLGSILCEPVLLWTS